jgi:hypothetical protein
MKIAHQRNLELLVTPARTVHPRDDGYVPYLEELSACASKLQDEAYKELRRIAERKDYAWGKRRPQNAQSLSITATYNLLEAIAGSHPKQTIMNLIATFEVGVI